MTQEWVAFIGTDVALECKDHPNGNAGQVKLEGQGCMRNSRKLPPAARSHRRGKRAVHIMLLVHL